MSWHWRYEGAGGRPVAPPPSAVTGGFPSQAEAEAWLGETWSDLLAAGVEQVTLLEEDRVVYGPMSLRPA